MKVIINATPLIHLGKLGKLNLLTQLYSNIITTREVKNEVLTKNYPEYSVLKMAFDNWIMIQDANDKTVMDNLILSQQIDLGEASVIALALEQENDVLLLLDDLIARSIAKSLGIKISGTLGIILEALYSKILSTDEIKLLFDDLVTETSFRISVKLYQSITQLINSFQDK